VNEDWDWKFQGLRFYRGSNFWFSYWFLHGPYMYNSAALMRSMWSANKRIQNLVFKSFIHSIILLFIHCDWKYARRVLRSPEYRKSSRTETVSDTSGHSRPTSGHRFLATDSDQSLTKSKYFITVALADRLAADDVAAVVRGKQWRVFHFMMAYFLLNCITWYGTGSLFS